MSIETVQHADTPQQGFWIRIDSNGLERREFRRHCMERFDIEVERWDAQRQRGVPFGRIIDISAGGVRIRTSQTCIRPDQQIRVRIELPDYAGIYPFVDMQSDQPRPKREWVGWMTVARVAPAEDGMTDIGGRLVDMDEMDRGMLRLYLSTQPLAA